MRKVIYLDQEGIDSMVQKPDAWKQESYGRMRALQDGNIDEVTFPDMIIRRKKPETKSTHFLVCDVELKTVMQGDSLYEIWEQINALKLGPYRKVEITNIQDCKQVNPVPVKLI